MRIFFSLCTELPLCFKEEIFGCASQPGGIRRTFDTPPPRQLTSPLRLVQALLKGQFSHYPPFIKSMQ